jgi:hypothetical protein
MLPLNRREMIVAAAASALVPTAASAGECLRPGKKESTRGMQFPS